MKARIFCKFGEMKGAAFELGNESSIGRADANAIVLPHHSVSTKHARIYFDGEKGRYVLEDLGSLNGTRLDGTRVRGKESLGHLHLVTFGESLNFIFQDMELCRKRASRAVKTKPAPAAAAPPTPSDDEEQTHPEGEWLVVPTTLRDGESEQAAPDRTMIESAGVGLPGGILGGFTPPETDEASPEPPAPKTMKTELEAPQPAAPQPAAPQPETPTPSQPKAPDPEDAKVKPVAVPPRRQKKGHFLEIVNLGKQPLRFKLKEGENVVGRGSASDLVIRSNEVSRRHAVLTLAKGKVMLRDEGSTNKTFLDRKVVTGNVLVRPNGEVWFGKVHGKLIVIEES